MSHRQSAPVSADPDTPTPLEAAFGGAKELVALQGRLILRRSELDAECLARSGYSSPVQTSTDRALLFYYLTSKWSTSLGDPEYRARWGYGISTGYRPDGSQYPQDGSMYVDSDESVPEQQAPGETLDQDDTEAIAAINRCSRQGDKEMARRYPAALAVQQQFSVLPSSKAGMGAAQKRMLACLGENGYHTDDANTPGNSILMPSFAQLMVDGKPGPDFATRLPAFQRNEVALAKVEWDCRQKTVNPVIAGATRQAQLDLLERIPDVVAKVKVQGP